MKTALYRDFLPTVADFFVTETFISNHETIRAIRALTNCFEIDVCKSKLLHNSLISYLLILLFVSHITQVRSVLTRDHLGTGLL